MRGQLNPDAVREEKKRELAQALGRWGSGVLTVALPHDSPPTASGDLVKMLAWMWWVRMKPESISNEVPGD